MLATIISATSIISVIFIITVVIWVINLIRYYLHMIKKEKFNLDFNNLWLSAILTGPIPIVGLFTNSVCLDAFNRNMHHQSN